MAGKLFGVTIALLAAAVLLAAPSSLSGAEGEYDVVVIGGGGGGLAAAARLSQAGMKVLLIEQHYKAGGYMTNFERGDYTFEVSLHAMDGLDPGELTRSTFTGLGILDKVKPIKLDPMYRAVYPDFVMDVPADAEAYRELLKKEFPAEAKGIDRLFNTIQNIYGAINHLTGLMDGEDRAMSGIFRMPLRSLWSVMKYRNSTLSQLLDGYIHDEKLIAVFTQLSWFAGAEPDNVSALFFAVMWGSYHFGGYYYFEGGSQAVSDALVEVIEEHGGEVMLNTKAVKIVIEEGRAVAVRTEDGDEFKCRYVVSNANAPDTFFKMIGREHLPASCVRRLEGMEIGLSAFQVFLGVNRDYSDYFPPGVHELVINVTYDQKDNFRFFHEGAPEKAPYAIVNYSLVDPTAAPPGKSVICLTSIMPYDWRDHWRIRESYAEYTKLKNETGMIFVKRAEQYLPGLSEHIEVFEVGSPRTMEHYTLNPQGSIFGWDNIPEQSMMKRLPNKTPIKNLYLAGAWTFPGGGQSAVLASGRLTAESILKQDKRK